ncbi:DUF2690 domain-containing protein, partial [Streptomyces lycii]
LVAAAAVILSGAGSGGEKPGKSAVTPPPTASRTPALPAGVECAGDDCAGQDPEERGCGGEHARTVTDARVGSAFVEVRFSEVCGAAWARISEAAPGDSVEITAGERSESAETAAGSGAGSATAYTRMVPAAAPEDVRACATTAAGESGCTPPGSASPERDAAGAPEESGTGT